MTGREEGGGSVLGSMECFSVLNESQIFTCNDETVKYL